MKQLLFFLFCCSIFSVNAQRFDGGIVLGFTASQIDGDQLAGFNKGGLLAGFYAETRLKKHLRFTGEIEYYQKGAAVSRQDNSVYGKRLLHYVEIPLALNYDYNKKVAVHAGLAPAYFFGGKQEGTVYDNGEVDFYNALDLGWLAGISYQTGDRINLRIRYTYSLLTISQEKTEGYQYSWIARAIGYNKGDYNNSLQLSLLYALSR